MYLLIFSQCNHGYCRDAFFFILQSPQNSGMNRGKRRPRIHMRAEPSMLLSTWQSPMPSIAAPARRRVGPPSSAGRRGSPRPVNFVDLGSQPGAYLLAIDLRTPVTVAMPRRPTRTLAPGHYLYCGSAHGPGGLAARLGRHLRADKKPHWHIDQLTGLAAIAGIAVCPAGRECDIVDLLSATADVSFPVTGFGSSDCRRCAAHLLQVAGRFRLPPGLVSVQLPGEGG